MTSKAAQKYISERVKVEREAGYPEKQAVAIAYSEARRAGYKVPKRSSEKRKLGRL